MALSVIRLGVGICRTFERHMLQIRSFNCYLRCEHLGISKYKTLIGDTDIVKPSVFNTSIHRHYAKGKDKKKSDKGLHKKKINLNEEIVSEVIPLETVKAAMQQTIDHLKENYVKNVSLRSAIGSIETIEVIFEGKTYPLEELAQVVRKNPKTLVINMVSFPQAIPAVVSALSKSGMNLNPQQDGTTLYVPVPKVTKEHRENLSKNAKALFQTCKDSIRDIKNKYLRTIKNKERDGLSQDLSHQISDLLVQIHDEYVEEASKILQLKQQELLGDS